MLYRQKFDTFIRIYDDIGYIVGKSDFGDRVVDSSGAVFLSALSRIPKTLDEISIEIADNFVGITPLEIQNDIKNFVINTIVTDIFHRLQALQFFCFPSRASFLKLPSFAHFLKK